MTLNDAVALRTKRLLKEKQITRYRLEQDGDIPHGALERILNGKNRTVTITMVYKLARGFGLTAHQFLDDDLFRSEDLEID